MTSSPEGSSHIEQHADRSVRRYDGERRVLAGDLAAQAVGVLAAMKQLPFRDGQGRAASRREHQHAIDDMDHAVRRSTLEIVTIEVLLDRRSRPCRWLLHVSRLRRLHLLLVGEVEGLQVAGHALQARHLVRYALFSGLIIVHGAAAAAELVSRARDLRTASPSSVAPGGRLHRRDQRGVILRVDRVLV